MNMLPYRSVIFHFGALNTFNYVLSHTSKRLMWSCLRGSVHPLCSQLTSIKLLIENPVQLCNNIQNSRCTWSEASEGQNQKSLTGKTNWKGRGRKAKSRDTYPKSELKTEDKGKHKDEMRESTWNKTRRSLNRPTLDCMYWWEDTTTRHRWNESGQEGNKGRAVAQNMSTWLEKREN